MLLPSLLLSTLACAPDPSGGSGPLDDGGSPTDGATPTDGGTDTTSTRPPLDLQIGSCDALLDPLSFDSEEVRQAARALVEALEPPRLPSLTRLDSVIDAVGDPGACVAVTEGLGWSYQVDAGEAGCTSADGSRWWGTLDEQGSLQNSTLTASAFAVRPASGQVTLLQVDGATSHEWDSGYGVQPFVGSAALYVHIDAPDGEEWYIRYDKPDFDGPAEGYIRWLSGEAGPVGDFCFQATYDVAYLAEVELTGG